MALPYIAHLNRTMASLLPTNVARRRSSSTIIHHHPAIVATINSGLDVLWKSNKFIKYRDICCFSRRCLVGTSTEGENDPWNNSTRCLSQRQRQQRNLKRRLSFHTTVSTTIPDVVVVGNGNPSLLRKHYGRYGVWKTHRNKKMHSSSLFHSSSRSSSSSTSSCTLTTSADKTKEHDDHHGGGDDQRIIISYITDIEVRSNRFFV